MRKILIIGATSAIAQETARIFAARGDAFYLIARDEEKLKEVADDLKTRGAREVLFRALDANEIDKHVEVLDEADKKFFNLDTLLITYGSLPDQKACERDFSLFQEEFMTNFTSLASFLTRSANRFEARGQGTIAVISSVAGDRGRQSNYVYGAAKGALTIFLEGLRNRLHASNVNVLTIKPGFVDTPMTAHLKKGPLFVSPEVIAKGIVKAIEKKKDVVYLPSFWLVIMSIIKLIPEGIFKRLKL